MIVKFREMEKPRVVFMWLENKILTFFDINACMETYDNHLMFNCETASSFVDPKHSVWIRVGELYQVENDGH